MIASLRDNSRRTMLLTNSILFLLLVASIMGEGILQEPNDAGVPTKLRSLELAERQIDWIRAKGGFYSPKVTMAPVFESNDENVRLGLFATESVSEGETIMVIPRRCLLTTGTDSEFMCDTAKNLLKQHKLGKESDFEPYVSYVFSKDRILLPSTWSRRGRSLLLQIRGTNLPPADMTQVSIFDHCDDWANENPDELELEEFAYLSVVSRPWSDKLVPIFDMINHHSGRYANVDSNSIDGEEDITVYATRDIRAGEQLAISYMECFEYRDLELDYVLPHMLRDFGFVARYPQRWTFPADEDLIFDIDFLNEEADALYGSGVLKPEMKITWHTSEPTAKGLKFLNKELDRIEKLTAYVTQAANELEDPNERDVTLDYYNSLAMALRYATGNVPREEACGMSDGTPCRSESGSVEGSTTTQIVTSSSRPLPTYNGSNPEHWMACEDYWVVQLTYKNAASFKSHYQEVDIFYGKKDDDMCLYLEGYLHTCASSRPHYHEVFVHYPARYLDQVKRVLFIGGGDSMVLHEVLKYGDLELVVGLELDQRVARASFNNFGTQPHFDDERVQWYFGDAAKSLLVLPNEYYGSFDLVIVDILTEVAMQLEVNEELKVMEAAMLLMKPDGIIVKNEDEGYVPGTNADYTKYSVDLIFHDVPLYCLQIFVVGSNTIDFLTAQPKDHEVETLYLEGVDDFVAQFDSWYNFGYAERICDKEENSEASINHDEWVGVLMVLEAEDIAVQLQSAEDVKPRIAAASSRVGLSEVDFVSNPYSWNGVTGFSLAVIAGEGYVVARCNPELRYCAFDIQLYGAISQKLEDLKAGLVQAIQSNRFSSYRFVTAGIYGLENVNNRKIGPPPAIDICHLDNKGVQGTAPQLMVRHERPVDDFTEQKYATLHSYNLTSALSQRQSQRPFGTQALLQLNVPLFWVGENVLVESDGTRVVGTIVKYNSEDFTYDVRHEGESTTVQRRVQEDTILRNKKFKISLVSTFITKAIDEVLESGGHPLMPENFSQKEVSTGIGEGLTIVRSWQEGIAVAVWDGRSDVTLNFFFKSVEVDLHEFFKEILDDSVRMEGLDVFPRGMGNIVSFEKDLGDEHPVWANEPDTT